MNRIVKKLFIILLALAAVVCLVVGAACTNEGEDEPNAVTVTLISQDGKSQQSLWLPGDPLPTVTEENKDFEGYWTDAGYTQRYEGTVVPDANITLYYKLLSQYYNIVLDYGPLGTVEFGQVAIGESVTLPERCPEGAEFAGFATAPGAAVQYPTGTPVLNIAAKGETVTLYAVWTTPEDEEFVIDDNGVVTAYNGSASSVTFPMSASAIGEGVFKNNSVRGKITSVTVPDCYTSIACGAFEGLSGLEMLTVPFIGGSRLQDRFLAYVFGAEKYTDNYYSFSVYTDGENIAQSEMDDASLYIPQTLRTVRVTESVRDIAEGAFYYAYSLENLVLDYPEDLIRIGESAFEACYMFGTDGTTGTAVCPEWLQYVSYIGDRAFRSYTGDVNGAATLPGYDDYELLDYEVPLNNLTMIPVLENVVTIGEDAFYYCAMLNSLEFGDKLESIGTQAFMFTAAVTELTFPDSLLTIGDFAFNGSGVNTIIFGTGIRSIGTLAFAQCTSLAGIIFTGDSIPVLVGKQCFNNNVTESEVSDAWNIILDDDFCITVKDELAASFRLAPDFANYFGYINRGTAYEDALGEAYFSLYGDGWDARFTFLSGNTVLVNDPELAFLNYMDYYQQYSSSVGINYPLRYKVLSDEEYEAVAGENAKPLYENQVAVSMWHPLIYKLDEEGNAVTNDELYFVITYVPYDSEEGRVMLPVLRGLEIDGSNPDTVVGSEEEGTFNIVFNAFGVPQLYKVVEGKQVLQGEPEGTYFATVVTDMSAGYAVNNLNGYEEFSSATRVTILYYNKDFAEISRRDFVYDVSVLMSDQYASVPLRELGENEQALLTGATYNDSQLFIKGKTADIFMGDVWYTASVSVVGGTAYGQDGYTVNFTSFKQSGTPVADLTGKAVFYDFDGENYARIDLTVGEDGVMILNTVNYTDWQIAYYNQLASEPEVILPTYSSLGSAWRYKKLSDPEVLGSYNLYTYNGNSYFRQLDKDGNVTAFGVAEIKADGVTLTPAGGKALSGTFSGSGLTVGGKTYTYYDYLTDITIESYEDIYGIMQEWTYTVKADGYGNMYFLYETDSGNPEGNLEMIGTYELSDAFGGSDSSVIAIEFTGKQLYMGKPDGESILCIFMYDGSDLTLRSSAEDSPWQTDLLYFIPYADEGDGQIEVVDELGYKAFDITLDIFSLEQLTMPKFTAYGYTFDENGKPVYSEIESEVAYFVTVLDENNTLSFLVAVGNDGKSLFSVRPVESSAKDAEGEEGADEDAPLKFEIVRDGGLVVSYGDTAITPNLSAMDKAPEGGVSFGKL